MESKHHAGLLSRKNGGLCFIGTTIGEIQGRREWTKNADTRLWVKNAIRRCHTGEMRSPSGRTNLRKVASSYEKEKDSVVHVDEKDTNGIRVRLPRQSRAAWSHSTMLLTVAYVQCLVKDAESLSSNNPKTDYPKSLSHYPKTAGCLTRKRTSAKNLTSSTSATFRTTQTSLLTALVSPAGTRSQHISSHPRRVPASLILRPCAYVAAG